MDDADQSKRSLVDTLWHEFRHGGASQARDHLILHYSPLVKYVAGRLSMGLPPTVEQSDLISLGIFGLMDAIERFDPARNIRFETYAVTRIKGAIIDELRSIDWVPRSVRAKGRAVEHAYTALEAGLRRNPSDLEVAEEMGISEAELQRIFAQISFVGLAALDEVLARGAEAAPGEPITLGESLPDPGGGPVVAFELEELKQVLAGAVNRLADRAKTVLTLYYYEGLTLNEIGQVLGVTESRVCQIHTQAVLQLRAQIAGPDRRSR